MFDVKVGSISSSGSGSVMVSSSNEGSISVGTSSSTVNGVSMLGSSVLLQATNRNKVKIIRKKQFFSTLLILL